MKEGGERQRYSENAKCARPRKNVDERKKNSVANLLQMVRPMNDKEIIANGLKSQPHFFNVVNVI